MLRHAAVVSVFPNAPMATSKASQRRPRNSAAEAKGAVLLMSVYLVPRWCRDSKAKTQRDAVGFDGTYLRAMAIAGCLIPFPGPILT